MIERKVQELQYFFYSQAFADGFRITFAILFPALFGLYFNHFDTGLIISTGAVIVNLVDAPGPFVHKKNGLLICSAFIFLVAVITPFARLNVYTMGLEIAVVTFFFSMFNAYGTRASSVGNAAILTMIFTMDKLISLPDILPNALLIFTGCLFYTILSLLLFKLRPYRIAQRTLGDCMREMAIYLSIKADFYNPTTDLATNYNKLVNQQIVVHEKQDALRELLFKTRQIISETTATGRKLVFTFVETVDLFENITATFYDYELLRKNYADTEILEKFSTALKQMAAELDSMGIAVQANTSFKKTFDYDEAIRHLKDAIDAIEPSVKQTGQLKKILVNIRQLLNHFNTLSQYFQDIELKISTTDHTRFVSHQTLNPKIFFNNLTFHSAVFKHALRVCIACVAGFSIAKIIAYGHHSYWILMTIAFMLKPAFSLTKQRNIQRIIGTLAGGIIGVLILLFIPNKTVQFIFMIIFMLGTYSFMRIKYLVMVVCTTPYVLILFHLLGADFIHLAGERLLDTSIGCAIAFIAGYFLFPIWEAHQLQPYMLQMLQANKQYLQKVLSALLGHEVTQLDYKLSRKEVYVASANLSSAFQRMLSEPKSKQTNDKLVHQFVVLNHILFSNIASVATTLLSQNPRLHSSPLVSAAKRSLRYLNDSVCLFSPGQIKDNVQQIRTESVDVLQADEKPIREQLEFIERISGDVEKATLKYIRTVGA